MLLDTHGPLSSHLNKWLGKRIKRELSNVSYIDINTNVKYELYMSLSRGRVGNLSAIGSVKESKFSQSNGEILSQLFSLFCLKAYQY